MIVLIRDKRAKDDADKISLKTFLNFNSITVATQFFINEPTQK